MLERIQSGSSRSSGDDIRDFKTGTGGTIEAEFLVHALQMRSGIWEPNWQRALTALCEQEVIPPTEANNAAQSYDLLRRVEAILRRFENKNVSSLSPTDVEQKKLAKRLGYKDVDAFANEYGKARETIQTLYQRYIKRG